MGSSIALYFLGNELLSTSPIQTDPLPHSLAFCCAECGEIWARIWIEGRNWSFVQSPCELHQWQGVLDWGAVPGSIIQGSVSSEGRWCWAGCIEYLPLAVMKRELEVHLRMKEKEIGNGQETLDIRTL